MCVMWKQEYVQYSTVQYSTQYLLYIMYTTCSHVFDIFCAGALKFISIPRLGDCASQVGMCFASKALTTISSQF